MLFMAAFFRDCSENCVNLRIGVEWKHRFGGLSYEQKETKPRGTSPASKDPGVTASEQHQQHGGYPFQIVEDDLYCPVGGIPYTSVIASFRCDDVDRHKGFFEKRYFVGKGETNGVVELSRLHGSERYAVCFDARQAAVAGVESSQDPFHEL